MLNNNKRWRYGYHFRDPEFQKLSPNNTRLYASPMNLMWYAPGYIVNKLSLWNDEERSLMLCIFKNTSESVHSATGYPLKCIIHPTGVNNDWLSTRTLAEFPLSYPGSFVIFWIHSMRWCPPMRWCELDPMRWCELDPNAATAIFIAVVFWGDTETKTNPEQHLMITPT